MKVIVTDISTSDVIVYTLNEDYFNYKKEDEDESEVIENVISKYHKLGNVSWMQLEDDFKIEFKNI